MKGVQFGNYHSFYEWGLILSSKEINRAEPKIKHIEIEGSDGVLDLTEFSGEVKYKNRTLLFNFKKANIVQDGYLALYSLVQNKIHGKVMNVILDDDPNYYYRGRVSINDWKSDKNIGLIVVEVDAEPYKYKLTETVVTQAVTDSVTVTLSNTRKRVVPIIDITGNINLTFGSNYYSLGAGRYELPQVQLEEGNNSILLAGTGTVTFTYREGSL